MSQPITIRVVPLCGQRGTGRFAIVDPADYGTVIKHRWLLDKDGYAVAWMRTSTSRRLIGMHRLVNNTPAGLLTDHVNGLRLDNRRSNLRSVTNSENQANRHPMPGASAFKGVSRERGKWYAYIRVNRHRTRLGFFESEEDAARAYDRAAHTAWGSNARLNFPNIPPD